MFIRTKRSVQNGATYAYLQLVESFRDKGKPRHRVIANLGNIKALSPEIKKIVNGLLSACGEKPAIFAEDLRLVKVKEYGVRYVVEAVWGRLEIGKIIKAHMKKKKARLRYEEWIRMMVANKLSDPKSKLGIFRWLRGVYWPGHGFPEVILKEDLPEPQELKLAQQEVMKFYRAMDYLLEVKEELEKELYLKMRDLFSLSVDLVFYDLTSSYFEGEGPEGLAKLGYSRDHEPGKKQVVIGLIVCNGMPIGHEVFEGNRVDKKTVKEVLSRLKERFQIKQCIFVGDRGLISTENLEALEQEGFESILAMRRRRDKQVGTLLLQEAGIYCVEAEELWWREVSRQGVRYVICYNPEVGQEQKQRRREGIEAAKKQLEELKAKVSKKVPSEKTLVRRIEEILSHRHGRRFIDYQLKSDQKTFAYGEKAEAIKLEEALEGVYILRTQEEKLTSVQIIEAYKDLMYVERCFRTMKSVLDLRPFWHRIEDRVRAHALICYLALLIHRYVERGLKAAGLSFSADHALESLKKLGAATMQVDDQRYTYTAEPTARQLSVFKALGLKAPSRCMIEN